MAGGGCAFLAYQTHSSKNWFSASTTYKRKILFFSVIQVEQFSKVRITRKPCPDVRLTLIDFVYAPKYLGILGDDLAGRESKMKRRIHHRIFLIIFQARLDELPELIILNNFFRCGASFSRSGLLTIIIFLEILIELLATHFPPCI